MVRRMACAGVLIAAFCVVVAAQDVVKDTGNRGLAVCVGVDKYPLLGDVADGRGHAQAVGRKLEAAGYRTVKVLLDGAEHWEDRAALANIREQVTQLAQLAEPGDTLLVFFSGRGIMVNGKPQLVPEHGDEDNTVPVEWVVSQMIASKATAKYLVIDATGGTEAVAGGLAGTGQARVTVVRAGDAPAAALRVQPTAKPKAGHGRIDFVVHRKVVMDIRGTTRETWRLNTLTLTTTFTFDLDTHRVIAVVEIPAGTYKIHQLKWEHWEKKWGYFQGGPYDPPPVDLAIKAGEHHEIKLINHQFPLSPHGTCIFYWDGRRISRINSLTKQVWVGDDIDRELAKEAPGPAIGTAVTVGNAQRGAKLYEMAMKGYAKALHDARETGNRVLIAPVAREMAWQLATARDEKFRSGARALALAEEAVQLAQETKADNVWHYTDALAAAQAEAGKAADAANTMKKALEEAKTAPTKPYPHIMTQLEERLKVYESGQAYHEK